MRNTFTRLTAALTAAVAMLAASGLPAAADVTTYAGRANGVGIELALLDTVTLGGGLSDAVITTGPTGSASGVGLDLLEMTASDVPATTGTAQDPDDPSQRNCLLPDEPSDLGLPVSGLTLGVVCSSAEVIAGAHAAGEAEIAGLDLDGTLVSDLVAFLMEQIGGDVAAALDEGLETVESTSGPLLEPVITPLAEQCEAGLEELLGALNPVLDGVQDLAEQDPTGIIATLQDTVLVAAVDAVGAFPEACSALLTLLLDLPSIQVTLETVQDALTAALEGLDLIEISIGGSTGTVDLSATQLVAQAGTLAAGVELPSLGALLDAIEIIVADLIGDLVEQTAGSIGESFEDLIPAVEAVLQPVLDALMLPDLLTATDPLLSIDVLPSSATATLDRANGSVVTSGEAVVVEVTLSEAFAALLGEESTRITVPGGESQTILEDTPLESTIAVADVSALTRDVQGVATTGTRAVGADLDLLTGVNGGIGLTIDAAEASVGGTTTAATPHDDGGQLPTTGGGLALAGLLAIGAAAAFRRRE